MTEIVEWKTYVSTNIMEHLLYPGHFSSLSDYVRNKRVKNPSLYVYILVAHERERHGESENKIIKMHSVSGRKCCGEK